MHQSKNVNLTYLNVLRDKENQINYILVLNTLSQSRA